MNCDQCGVCIGVKHLSRGWHLYTCETSGLPEGRASADFCSYDCLVAWAKPREYAVPTESSLCHRCGKNVEASGLMLRFRQEPYATGERGPWVRFCSQSCFAADSGRPALDWVWVWQLLLGGNAVTAHAAPSPVVH